MADHPAGQAKAKAVADLRAGAFAILEALDRAEPGSHVQQMREVVESARGVGAMRMIIRELMSIASTLPASRRQALERELQDRIPQQMAAEQQREEAVMARVRKRGGIRTEREYRIVQAYADRVSADPGAEAEFLALGALLDEYSAGPTLPNDR